ncbi:MAG: hypothetical protein QW756_02845 [Nitrososphaerota archaeon]
MASYSRSVAREELARIIELCEKVEKSGIDPFTVDVKGLLAKLRRILESHKNFETIVLDAETLYKVALLVALQHRWLRDRAASLFVDAQLIAVKILSADIKTLAHCLVSSWHPIVYGEQLTRGMLRDGLEYFLSLPTRAGRQASQPSEAGEFDKSAKELLEVFSQNVVLEDEVTSLHSEMIEAAGPRGRADYWRFLDMRGRPMRAHRAYIVSFIVSEGLANLQVNPITGEISLIPYERKVERKRVVSLPVSLGVGDVE